MARSLREGRGQLGWDLGSETCTYARRVECGERASGGVQGDAGCRCVAAWMPAGVAVEGGRVGDQVVRWFGDVLCLKGSWGVGGTGGMRCVVGRTAGCLTVRRGASLCERRSVSCALRWRWRWACCVTTG